MLWAKYGTIWGRYGALFYSQNRTTFPTHLSVCPSSLDSFQVIYIQNSKRITIVKNILQTVFISWEIHLPVVFSDHRITEL